MGRLLTQEWAHAYASYILQIAFCDRPMEYISALEILAGEQVSHSIDILSYCMDQGYEILDNP